MPEPMFEVLYDIAIKYGFKKSSETGVTYFGPDYQVIIFYAPHRSDGGAVYFNLHFDGELHDTDHQMVDISDPALIPAIEDAAKRAYRKSVMDGKLFSA